MIREDARPIRRLTKLCKGDMTVARKAQKSPLIYLKVEQMKQAEDFFKEIQGGSTVEINFPFDEFGVVIEIDETDTKLYIYVETLEEDLFSVICFMDFGFDYEEDKVLCFLSGLDFQETNFSPKKCRVIFDARLRKKLKKELKNEEEFSRFFIQDMERSFVILCRVCYWIQYGDKHMVERKPLKKPNKIDIEKGKKKPWQRKDLPSIILLDRMPSEKKEWQGGTHESPRPHVRRGHWRRLTHPRFQYHPQYGQRIWVKPSLIGDREKIVNGNIYKLIQTENPL